MKIIVSLTQGEKCYLTKNIFNGNSTNNTKDIWNTAYDLNIYLWFNIGFIYGLAPTSATPYLNNLTQSDGDSIQTRKKLGKRS